MEIINYFGDHNYKKIKDLESIRFDQSSFSFDNLNDNYLLKLK